MSTTQTILPQAANDYQRSLEQIFRRALEQKLSVFDSRIAAVEAVVADEQAAITDPAGGATIDAQARTAIIAILNALRAHGLIA